MLDTRGWKLDKCTQSSVVDGWEEGWTMSGEGSSHGLPSVWYIRTVIKLQ